MSNGEENISQARIEMETQIAAIDDLISFHLNQILHHEDFRRLEASWRGLHYLVNETQPNQQLKIKVLQVAQKDCLKDFERALEFDHSFLFKKVHDDIYGTFGEEPFGLLIGDYEFGNHPQEIALLEFFSQLSAMAHVPFISAASPSMFGWESFSGIHETRNIPGIFSRPEYVKWRSFRDSEDSRFVGLCLPRILLRDISELKSGDEFTLQRTIEPEVSLWGNAAYAFAGCVGKAYRESGWCGSLRGPNSDGLVEGLTNYGHEDFQPSVDLFITGEQEKELSDLGFIPLVQVSRNIVAFFSAQSCHRLRYYDSEAATKNARLFSQLPYILAISRFAHYLKVINRDRLQPFTSPQECRNELMQWLGQYYQPIRESEDEIRIRYPISEYLINIENVSDKRSFFKGALFLLPAYQLGELTISMRTVVYLPQSYTNSNNSESA